MEDVAFLQESRRMIKSIRKASRKHQKSCQSIVVSVSSFQEGNEVWKMSHFSKNHVDKEKHQNASKRGVESNEGNTLKSIKNRLKSNEANTAIITSYGGVVKVIKKGVEMSNMSEKASLVRSHMEMSELSCFSHCSVYFLHIKVHCSERCHKV